MKDKSYVALAYMTGILPIKKHSSGSALNMFEEFTFFKDRKFEEFFGFTQEEVKNLCNQNKKMTYGELESWYNGYMTATGIKVYNPRSVVLALSNNHCQSYWTNTGAMDEVLEYLKYNILEVRDDVIKMVNGEEVEIEIEEEYRAGQGEPRSREEIYFAMVVLGFLSYYEGLVKIPNNELMKEFKKSSFIVELKKDDNVDVALNQIIEKEYALKFKKEYEGRDILIVAICYDSKTKEHSCKIEKI